VLIDDMTNSLWDFGSLSLSSRAGWGTRLHLASYMTDGMVPPVVVVTRSYGGTSGNRQPGGGRQPQQAIIARHNQRPVWPAPRRSMTTH
jgi:hypothetical protein